MVKTSPVKRKGSTARSASVGKKSEKIDAKMNDDIYDDEESPVPEKRSSRDKLVRKDKESKTRKEPNLKGEWWNICVLMVLYTMQGIPMGLSAAVPLILTERGISYSDLGTFSLNSWPFSLKILWAPFVDALFIRRFGRRKTWLIPVQVCIGVAMIFISTHLDEWMGGSGQERTGDFRIMPLTGAFLVLYFLCATQDIAVDGWALTMLRPENVSYASTCNSAGQIAGYFFSFTGSLALQHFQLASLSEFVLYNGILFVVLTALVAVCKKEAPLTRSEAAEIESPVAIFKQIAVCFRVPAVRSLVTVLFLWKIPFAVNDALSGLKVQQAGMPKEHLAYLGLCITPFQIFVPLILGKSTAGEFPLTVVIRSYIPRVLMGLIALFMVMTVPPGLSQGAEIPVGYYSAIVIFSSIGAVLSSAFFCAQMAFFARISDKSIGGTYMTLLNTFANLGGMWTITFVLKTIDLISWESCDAEGICTKYDGYTVLVVLSTIIGVLGFPWLKKTLHSLQLRKENDWKIRA